MGMRKPDLSDSDFRGASLYRARLGETLLKNALAGADTSLSSAPLVEVCPRVSRCEPWLLYCVP